MNESKGAASGMLRDNLRTSIEAKRRLLEQDHCFEAFEKAVSLVIDALKKGGRLYIAGNGGSAADAQHLAAEFVSRLAMERAPLPAEALTVDTSILTAIGNDYGYEEVFARQIRAKLTDKDVFLAITTSGRSRNIVRALEECQAIRVPTILLTGHDGGVCRALADVCIAVPGDNTSTIQELHIVLEHSLCGAVEKALFGVTTS